MELLGIGSDFYVISRGNNFITYDEQSKKIAETYKYNDMYFKNAVGSTFNIQRGNNLQTYDRYCKKINERYNK